MKKNNDRECCALTFSKLIRVLKVTVVVNLLVVFGISASTYAQNQNISIRKSNTTISEILKEVEDMSEFTFFYNNNQINVNKKTNVNVKNGTLHDVLDQLLSGTEYEYRIVDRQVMINPKSAPVKQDRQQQARLVSGVVLDDVGEPVIGANVIVKGTTIGTITDFNGQFSIDAPENAILRVSYIGYIDREINIGNRMEVSIVLSEDAQALEEVVVVGYGVQKKVSLTGAISAVKSDEIITTKNENVQNMLTGKVSGIRVVQKSAEPGSFNNDFDIRGMGSPLYVIDGVPRENFNRLDPNDIESLTVLKDASAAIYGVRAANLY